MTIVPEKDVDGFPSREYGSSAPGSRAAGALHCPRASSTPWSDLGIEAGGC